MKTRQVSFLGTLFALTTLASAAPASPAIQSACHGSGVESTLASSYSLAVAAANRLNGLAALSSSQRASAWSSGAERRWFGDYSELRFKNVKGRMNGIVEVLDSWRLDIRCDWSKTYFGNASPAVYRITLGNDWRVEPSGSADKPQTFIHEAAHIKGAVLGGEARGKYGVSDALTRAQKHPGVSVRTAENIGYYAVCRSAAWAGKGGCP